MAQATVVAQKQFESAALTFFVETIKLCRAVRPKARWGYYGFPQSFTFDGYNDPAKGPILRALNDKLQPLWDASDILQPSIYLAQWSASAATLAKMNAAQINTTILESVRIQKQTRTRPEIWPFQYFYYNSGKQNVTLTTEDVRASVEFPYELGAKGLVIWGDPSYKNKTVPGSIAQFKRYFKQVLGPAVTVFTKSVSECADSRCNSHGRCTTLAAGTRCECEHGFDPAKNCSSILTIFISVKSDDALSPLDSRGASPSRLFAGEGTRTVFAAAGVPVTPPPPSLPPGDGPPDYQPYPPPCSCANRSLCQPIRSPAYGSRKEVAAVIVTGGDFYFQSWDVEAIDQRYIDWSVTTTIIYQGTDDHLITSNLTCDAHARGVRIVVCTPGFMGGAPGNLRQLANETERHRFIEYWHVYLESQGIDGMLP